MLGKYSHAAALRAADGMQTDPSYSKVQAAYETNWGAVISKAGATNPHVDFGNGFMNGASRKVSLSCR